MTFLISLTDRHLPTAPKSSGDLLPLTHLSCRPISLLRPPITPGEPTTPDHPPANDVPGVPAIPQVLGAVRRLGELPAVLGARRLPQTGQLWWPVPVMVILGIVLIVKGVKKTGNSNTH